MDGDVEVAAADYYRNERRELADLVPPGARRVLDVGCGEGMLGRLLKQRAPREVIGIEIMPAAAAAARRHLDDVVEVDLDTAPALPLPGGAFDCVICADVLEHLRDPERTLRLLRGHLAPGGTLVASIPNVRHANALLPLLVLGRWRYEDSGVLDRTHLRFFTPAEVPELLARTGFAIRHAVGTVTREHPGVPLLSEVVARLGGDGSRFRREASILQVLVVATPTP